MEVSMKALIRVFPLILAGLLLCVAFSVAKGGKPVVWPAGDVNWTASPTVKGASMAPLWGDPSKEAYGALKKVAGGTDLGWHTHTNDQKVVAISGTFDFQVEGQDAKELAAGSYIFMPGGMKHTAKCREGSDCMYFEESAGKSDFIPATAPAK
jgi:uncharacterized cupin superfamily protein